MDSKISIIIPIYKVEKYLEKCLDSVVNQTYKNLEIICVNDGSPDNSSDILNKFALNDSRIIIVNQENMGLSGARNSGFQRVTGEYVMYLDGDDWIDYDTCEQVLKKSTEKNVDVVFWTYMREFGDSSVRKCIFDESEIFFDKDMVKFQLHRRFFGLINEELAHPENGDAIVTAWGKLYKTSVIRNSKAEFIDTKKIGSEDVMFNIQVFGQVESALFINQTFNHYRKNNDTSLTSVYRSDFFDRWQNMFSEMQKYININNCPEIYQLSLYNRISISIISLGLNIINSNMSVCQKIAEFKKIFNTEKYKEALSYLKFNYFPLHWKIYFFFVKHRNAVATYMISKAIQKLRG